MADIVIQGVGIPKPNEGPYIMWVYPDGKTVVYSYVVNGNEFGPDSQKVIETTAVPLPEGTMVCPVCAKEDNDPGERSDIVSYIWRKQNGKQG